MAVVRQRRREPVQPRIPGRLIGRNTRATPRRAQARVGRQPRVMAQGCGVRQHLRLATAAQQRHAHGAGRRRAIVAVLQVFQEDGAGRGGARHAGNPAREQDRHQE
ncbi:MAG TPA: hypothetical protein VD995_05340 [Azospirillum sp.]|nr:hypothetical protein [Azospirillum sp.]